MKRILLCLFLLSLLTSCWSSQELDNTAFVHGVGFDKAGDKLRVTFEIIKPEGSEGGESGDEDNVSSGNGDSIVLEETADTLLEGSRKLIKYVKRRPNFSHTRVWIINEKLAKEKSVNTLDILRRDQMLRLNSHLFITKDNPTDILNTPTLYEHLVANELISSLQQTKYNAEYAPITMREFFKLLESPIPNAYIPIIYLTKVNKQKITAINGTAVIKKNHLVGELSNRETTGLNILLNHVKGGNIQVNLNEKEEISLEVKKLKTEIKPTLNGNQLNAKVETKIEGTLADNMTPRHINSEFFKEIETALEKHTKKTIRLTLEKLQKDLKTDITSIGLKTYRKYPTQWKKVSSDWDDVFENADISIDVDINILHKGLINKSINRHKKPHNNPYIFRKNK